MTPKICLNMIVKNESKIITRLLESALPIIDSYCICDTGSTDNTIQMIEDFFSSSQIPGKILQEPFKDFGYNRSYALKQCLDVPNADYILLLDADMILWVNPELSIQQFKESLIHDVYHVLQGSDSYYYKNVRIIKNIPGFSYWGVTHEYVSTPEGSKTSDIGKNVIFIKDIGDGGAKEDKFLRDIRLLKKGLDENPNSDRYTFYLANSYKDAGQMKNAIETYKKRIEIGCWREEVWHSYYSMAKCYMALGDVGNAIHSWLEAFHFYPDRLENLYEIIHYYRENGKNSTAYSIFCLAEEKRKVKTDYDHLFLQRDVYDYKLDYELSIIGYYCNYMNFDLIKSCMKVLACSMVDESTINNVLSNYKFYTTSLIEKGLFNNNVKVLKSIGETLDINKTDFVSSTPSLCLNENGELVVNVRYVNYRIDNEGNYINKDKIETINVVAVLDTRDEYQWIKKKEFILKYDESYDNVYVGLEDVRFFNHEGKMFYNANRGLNHGRMEVEHGYLDFDDTNKVESGLTKMAKQREIEKNWVLFCDGFRTMKMVYQWYPLTIGDLVRIDDTNNEKSLTQLVKSNEIETPNFFRYLRGSTNGVTIGDEIWFLCHIVSYEHRRYYYHIMVVLDSKTYAVKKYTQIFTFEKQPVEYTLGFIYMSSSRRFLIGYSTMDNETKYLTLQKFVIDSMMVTK